MNTKSLSKKKLPSHLVPNGLGGALNLKTLKETTLQPKAPVSIAAPMLGKLKIKQVFVADTGDGAFTDQSVKIKPNKTGAPGLVLKCVSLARLRTAIYQAQTEYAPEEAVIRKGRKHFIHVLGERQGHQARFAQSKEIKALASGKVKP